MDNFIFSKEDSYVISTELLSAQSLQGISMRVPYMFGVFFCEGNCFLSMVPRGFFLHTHAVACGRRFVPCPRILFSVLAALSSQMRATTDSFDSELHRCRLHWGRSLLLETRVVVAPSSFLGPLNFLNFPNRMRNSISSFRCMHSLIS